MTTKLHFESQDVCIGRKESVGPCCGPDLTNLSLDSKKPTVLYTPKGFCYKRILYTPTIQTQAPLKGETFIPKDKMCRSPRDFETCQLTIGMYGVLGQSTDGTWISAMNLVLAYVSAEQNSSLIDCLKDLGNSFSHSKF